jgi:cell division protease FtsH
MADEKRQPTPTEPPGSREPRDEEGRGPGEAPATGPTFKWRYLVWIGILLLLVLSRFFIDEVTAPEVLAYSEFKAAVRDGTVAKVVIQGQQITGTYVAGAGPAAEEETEATEPPADGGVAAVGQDEKGEADPERFVTTLPPVDDPGLMALLEEHGVEVEGRQEDSWLSPLILGVLPLLFLVGILFYTGRMMRQQLGDVGTRLSGFGQSKAKRYERTKSRVGFDDVAGLESAKREVGELVAYLKEPERFRKLGVKIPRGVLLMGPPGTGKTLLAKAVAGEADVPFYSISGSEFVEMFVGVGASRVRDMFANAKKESPAIIFVDEIDSVGRARGAGLGGGHDEREQTLNQILAEMDGFDAHEAVVVMAATNRPDVLDPALLRPGRFDRKITLELPQRQARLKILKVHTRKVPLSDDVDLESIAAGTVGFSGADLENLINEAALIAAREEKPAVERVDFEQARERILFGSEREDLNIEKEKRAIAYHESGHALVAWLLPDTDPLKKVTIIPRGRALGVTEQVPEEDRHNVVRSYLLDRIAVMLGGRAAEKVVFGQVSSGAEQDLKEVTKLARRMVCQWGMSDRLAPVAFRHGEEHVFLGREMTQAKDFSEHTARIIDEEISAIAREMEEKAVALLTDHRDRLDALAEALIERETLAAEEIEELLGPKPDSPEPEPVAAEHE